MFAHCSKKTINNYVINHKTFYVSKYGEVFSTNRPQVVD